jgi:perosamine synthetase
MNSPAFSVQDVSGHVMEDVSRYVCRASDGLWSAVEQCLDTVAGTVFVVDSDDALMGRLTLRQLRAAIRDGAHLGAVSAGDLALPIDFNDLSEVRPVLDGDGRIIAVDQPAGNHLPVAEPDLSRAEFRNVIDAFLSTWISSQGEYIPEFEQAFAARVGMGYGVATSNGTVSLQLAMVALGVGPGDEVIVPDLTFAASANSVINAGATPVLVDVDQDTWCLSIEAIERAITPRTRAVMPVHLFGRPAPMTEIKRLADRHGFFIIEDCAEAHGARYDGQPVGSFSDVSSFSFFANKIITTGEGGMCVTSNPELAERMRMLRDHGMRRDRRYWHDEVGFNFRMTNLQAAIGCAQLARMDDFLTMRDRVHAMYKVALTDLAGVSFPPEMPPRHQPVTWFSCVLVDPAARQSLIDDCRAIGIDIRPFFHGLSTMPAYRRFARNAPVSARLAASGLNLPTSRKVNQGVVDRVAEVFRKRLGTARA